MVTVVTKKNNLIQCKRCGYKHQFGKCPAYGKKCKSCDGMNHFAVGCYKNNKKNDSNDEQNGMNKKTGRNYNDNSSEIKKNVKKVVRSVECEIKDVINDKPGSDNEFLYIGTVDGLVGERAERSWTAELKINEKILKFMLDTGAMANIIAVETLKDLGYNIGKLRKTGIVLLSFSRNKLPVKGECTLRCRLGHTMVDIEFVVVEQSCIPILGLKTCSQLGLIKRVGEVREDNTADMVDELLKNFETVFQGIGRFEKSYTIELKNDYNPVIAPPRKIPFSLESKLKIELNTLEKNGIIKKIDEITDWLSPIVIVTKKNGNLRICPDPRDLNMAIKRNHCHIPTIDEITVKLKGCKYFSKLDATQGFAMIPLDEQSSKLCAFSVGGLGKYRYLRMPYGLACAPEVFQRRMNDVFSDLNGCSVYFDGLLVYSETIEEHIKKLKEVLERAWKNNVRFNREKCEFGLNEIVYLGHRISPEGITPDDSKIEAINRMMVQENVEAVQRFLGLVTYVGRFVENLADKTGPLRILLKKGHPFVWGKDQEAAFINLKKILCEAPCLGFYDVNQPVVITVDASKDGMGASLLQNGVPCAHASKALTETQKKYSQIEKECLAVWIGCERFHQYVFGLKSFIVETDHSPLIQIMKKSIDRSPPRLQRMLLQLRKFNFILIYKPGKTLIIADTLSRAFQTDRHFNEHRDIEIESQVCLVRSYLNASDEKVNELIEQTNNDIELQKVKNYVLNGWPDRRDCLPLDIRVYYKFRSELAYNNQLLYKGQKLVVPSAARHGILSALHGVSHPGVKRCTETANLSFYWPSMCSEIKQFVLSCRVCQQYSNNNSSEPLISHDVPKVLSKKTEKKMFVLNAST